MKLVSIIDGWTVDMIFNSFIIFSQLIWLMFTNTNPPPPYFDMWQESTHICAKSSGRTITFHALQCYKGFRASAAPKLGVPIWMMFTNTQTHIRPPQGLVTGEHTQGEICWRRYQLLLIGFPGRDTQLRSGLLLVMSNEHFWFLSLLPANIFSCNI